MRKAVLFAGVASIALFPGIANADGTGRWSGFYGGFLAGWADGTGDVDYTRISHMALLIDAIDR